MQPRWGLMLRSAGHGNRQKINLWRSSLSIIWSFLLPKCNSVLSYQTLLWSIQPLSRKTNYDNFPLGPQKHIARFYSSTVLLLTWPFFPFAELMTPSSPSVSNALHCHGDFWYRINLSSREKNSYYLVSAFLCSSFASGGRKYSSAHSSYISSL